MKTKISLVFLVLLVAVGFLILSQGCDNDLLTAIEQDVLSGTVADPVITPFGGTYLDAQTVTIECATDGASIRYTLDGSDPSPAHGFEYDGTFDIDAGTVTLKAIAFREHWVSSQIVSTTFEITGKAGAPVFSKTPGPYTEPISVELSSSTVSAVIRYTINGSTPSRTEGITYTGTAISITTDTTIKAIAYVPAWDVSSDSNISTGTFEITGKVANPTISPAAGYYTTATTVSLSCTTSGTAIRYTTNGTNPTRTNGTLYSSAFSVSSTSTVKALAYVPAWEATSDSDISSSTYTITGYCASPSFSVGTGYYDNAQNVALSCTTGGAVIKYTTDGSTPTRSHGSSYSSPVAITKTSTLKAIAYVPAWQTSSDSTGLRSYTISGSYNTTRRIGGPDIEITLAAVRDSSDNSYLVGMFRDTVNFGADFGVTDTITATGNPDTFITRINSNGSYGWTRVLGPNCIPYDMAIDSSNNIYVTGVFTGTVNFRADFGGTDTRTSQNSGSSIDIFVTKITSTGGYGWTRRFGGTNSDGEPRIAIDLDNNIYLAGQFWGTINNRLDFGGTDNKTSAGGYDVFLTKINNNLTYGWTRIFGGTGSESCGGVAASSSGDAIVTGEFTGTVDFGTDFAINQTKISQGGWDIFLARVKPTSYLWYIRRIGGSGNEEAKRIRSVGNYIYLTGTFEDSVIFAADFLGTDTKVSAGKKDVFLTKFTSTLSYGWTKRLGSTEDDTGMDATADSAGNIYLTGNFQQTVNFASDFGGTDNKISAGFADAFVTKMASNGIYRWTRRIGNFTNTGGVTILSFSDKSVMLSSAFADTVNFAEDFGGTDTKSSNGTNMDTAFTWID